MQLLRPVQLCASCLTHPRCHLDTASQVSETRLPLMSASWDRGSELPVGIAEASFQYLGVANSSSMGPFAKAPGGDCAALRTCAG
eukprot:4971229-Pleurochrysis_carterae.AAC.1